MYKLLIMACRAVCLHYAMTHTVPPTACCEAMICGAVLPLSWRDSAVAAPDARLSATLPSYLHDKCGVLVIHCCINLAATVPRTAQRARMSWIYYLHYYGQSQ